MMRFSNIDDLNSAVTGSISANLFYKDGKHTMDSLSAAQSRFHGVFTDSVCANMNSYINEKRYTVIECLDTKRGSYVYFYISDPTSKYHLTGFGIPAGSTVTGTTADSIYVYPYKDDVPHGSVFDSKEIYTFENGRFKFQQTLYSPPQVPVATIDPDRSPIVAHDTPEEDEIDRLKKLSKDGHSTAIHKS